MLKTIKLSHDVKVSSLAYKALSPTNTQCHRLNLNLT